MRILRRNSTVLSQLPAVRPVSSYSLGLFSRWLWLRSLTKFGLDPTRAVAIVQVSATLDSIGLY